MTNFAVVLSLLGATPNSTPPSDQSIAVPRSAAETLRDWSRKLIDARNSENQMYEVFVKSVRGLPAPAMQEIYEARIAAIEKKSKELQKQTEKFIGMETKFIDGIAQIDKAPEDQKTARTIDALQAFVNEGIASQKIKQFLAQGAPRRESVGEMKRILQAISQEIVTERMLLGELNDMRQTQAKLAAELREAIASDLVFRQRLAVIEAAIIVVEWAQFHLHAEPLK